MSELIKVPAPRIYFVGAHRTGKTTCATWAKETYGLPMITELARTVLAEIGGDLGPLRTDLKAVANYQEEVFRRQIRAEREHPGGFVSDRSFDNLAYAAEFTEQTFPGLMESPELREYVEWVRGGVVFFIRPHKRLLVADSVNKEVDWEQVIRIDGMVKLMLKLFRIDYLPIHAVEMEERVRSMRFALDKLILPA